MARRPPSMPPLPASPSSKPAEKVGDSGGGAELPGGAPASRAPKRVIDALWRWLSIQTSEDLLPREALHEFSDAVSGSADAAAARHGIILVFSRVEKQLRRETRSLREVVGDKVTDNLLQKVSETIESSQGTALETFMRSKQVGEIVSALLYETLVEFVRRSNLIGSFVRGLPVFGPIQDQIDRTVKVLLDRDLGVLIKRFLAEYISTATDRILEMANTPENRKSFGDLASGILSKELIDRRISDLVPDEATTTSVKESIAEMLEPSSGSSVTPAAVVDMVYDTLGEQTLGDIQRLVVGSPVAEVAASAATVRNSTAGPEGLELLLGPKTRSALMQTWRRFVTSPEGQEALVGALDVAMSAIAPTTSRAAAPAAEAASAAEA